MEGQTVAIGINLTANVNIHFFAVIQSIEYFFVGLLVRKKYLYKLFIFILMFKPKYCQETFNNFLAVKT